MFKKSLFIFSMFIVFAFFKTFISAAIKEHILQPYHIAMFSGAFVGALFSLIPIIYAYEKSLSFKHVKLLSFTICVIAGGIGGILMAFPVSILLTGFLYYKHNKASDNNVNKIVQFIVMIYLIMVIEIMVFVPWQRLHPSKPYLKMDMGYTFIWNVPSSGTAIDYSKITLEFITLSAMFGILYIVLRNKYYKS